MADELGMPQEPRDQECDPEAVAMTLDMIEKGARELFLDGKLEPEETKSVLASIQKARQACESGDEDACIVLDNLMHELTENDKQG